MSPAWLVLLSVRKLFGFLLPGFVWLVLLSVWKAPLLETLIFKVEGVWSHAGFVVPSAIIASYFLGAISTVVAFRLLEGFGDVVDYLVSLISIRWVLAVVQAVSDRLHILSTHTLGQDQRLLQDGTVDRHDFAAEFATQTGNERWGVWKLYVLERAPALAKESLDIEGEINFMAGMFGPSIGVAIWAIADGNGIVGGILCAVALYLALRFQALRHHELWFTAQAYGVARQIAGERAATGKPAESS